MPLIWKGCGPRKYFLHLEIGNLHRLALKKYADSSVTRCLSSLGLCYPFASFPPLWRRCHLGCFLNQTTRIRSSNCNMCQTALNLEPPLQRCPSVRYPFLVFLRSVFVKKKGANGGAAVAIEVITGGWNCRLWNRAHRKVEAGSVGAENQNTELPIRAPESIPPKKRSPYNLPCGETSISLAPSVRHRVISRR